MTEPDRITLTLPADTSLALRQAVADGEYGSVEDAVADALSTWRHRHEDRAETLAEIRAMVGASIHDPRPSLSLDEVDAHMDAFFRNVSRSRADEAA